MVANSVEHLIQTIHIHNLNYQSIILKYQIEPSRYPSMELFDNALLNWKKMQFLGGQWQWPWPLLKTSLARFIRSAKVSISNTFAYFSIHIKVSICNAKVSVCLRK